MTTLNSAQHISKLEEKVFEKYKTISSISNLITPQEPQSMSCKPMELNRAK